MGISRGTNRGDAELVERYINTAYDNVKIVADGMPKVDTVVDNLNHLTTVSNNIANVNIIGSGIEDVNYLADNFVELQDISENFQEFKGMYYGPSATVPTTRPNGDPIEEGDMYLDTNSKVLFIRVETQWNSITANLTFNESVTISSSNRVGNNTVVEFSNSYSVGRNSLIVFVNNIYQANSSTSTQGTYVESTNNTITFPNLLLQDGDEVSVIIGSVVDTINPVVRVTKLRYVTTEANEQAIPLPNSEQYVVGNDSLEVYVNGTLATTDIDYYETNATTVTFANALEAETEIIFKKGNLVSTEGITVIQEGDVVVLNLASEFFSTRDTLDTTKTVHLSAYSMANDGRSGIYVYNPTRDKSTADGVRYIDSSLVIANQGIGSGLGVWELQLGLQMEYIDAYLGSVYEAL